MKKRHIAIFAAAALLNVEIIVASEHNQTKEEVVNAKATLKQSQENNISQEDKVLAVVNGKKIMQSYFDKGFHDAPIKNKIKILQRVISSELLVQYASTQSLYSDKTLVKKVKKHGEKLKEAGEKFTDLDARMVLGLMVANQIASDSVEAEITQEAIKKYYSQRKRNFTHMAYAEAYSINVSSNNEANDIIDILDKAKDKKSTFIKMAAKYDTKHKTGYTGKIYKFGIPRSTFNLALFSQKKDTYNKTPLEIDGKYFIIYTSKTSNTSESPSQKDLEKNIQYVLKLKLGNTWINNKLDELKKTSTIINNLK